MSDGYSSSASAYTVDDISAASSPRSSTNDDRNVRRLRPRGSSVHTAAAMDVVDQWRRSQGTPTTRSVRYSESIRAPLSPHLRVNSAPRPRTSALTPARPVTSTARPGTAVSTTAAAALASVVPSSSDRLKHLQLHMEQLQQLYAQEIHKEELGRREAFVQSMCTASITLWRYVCSKPRFFTAVKALMTQYLPANDARLYEVEESEGQLMLVLAEGRAISVQGRCGSEAASVIAHAVRATNQLSATQWTALQENVAQRNAADGVIGTPPGASVSPSSSMSSSARSSLTAADSPHASKSRWLDRHADCVLPSVNDHVFVLLPLDRVYRDSGFNPEIDLTIKKRDLFEGATTKQLLVVVLRDAQQRPIGALEALVTTRKPLQIDFLDAFASLLAAALEARRSICRPTTGTGLRVQILHVHNEKDAVSPDIPSRESPIVALEIAPGIKMVLTGTSLQSTENDLPLLTAVQKPMAELFLHSQEWQRRTQFQQTLAVVEQSFWTTIVTLVLTTVSIGDAPSETDLRSGIQTAIQELGNALPFAVRFNVLFDGEPLDHLVDSDGPSPETAMTLSVEGQFAAMECAIRTGDTFSSTPFVTATPVVVGERKAAVLVLLESLDVVEDECAKSRTLPLVLRAVELVLWAENCQVERASARTEADSLRRSLKEEETRGCEREVVLTLSQSLAQCKSVEEIATQVHRLVEAQQQARLWVVRPAKVRLFMAEYATTGESSDDAPLTSIWTLQDDGTDGRVVVFDRDAVASPRRGPYQCLPLRGGGGVVAYVLEHQEPLTYTPQHVAYDPVLRHKLYQPPSDGVLDDYYYYALPLGNHGVVEFAFATEDQQKAFAANAVALVIGSTIETVLDLHAWVSTTAQQMKRATVDVDREQAEAWARWRDFVVTTSDAASLDLVGWKAAAESQLKNLIPRATHANVLVRGGPSVRSEWTGDDPLIESITRELENADGRASSPSLSVHHHTVLPSVWMHPLGDSGLLVLASTGDGSMEADSWALETSQFGPLAAQLLSLQLGHIRAQARWEAEVEPLRKSLLDADARVLTEQSQRAIVARHASQASLLVRVGRLQDSTNAVETMDDFVSRILDAITSESGLHAGLLVSSLGEMSDYEVWSTGTRVCRGLLSSELRWMSAAQASTRTYQAPLFAALQQDLVRQLWPHELITESSRFTVATLNQWLPPDEDTGQERVAYLVVLERDVDDDSVGSTIDEAFAAELANTVARVFAWYHEKQRERGVNGRLLETADAWERTRAELQTAHESHDAWAQIWRRVLGRLLTVGTATTCEDTEWTVVCHELTTAIQQHVQAQIGNSHERLSPLEVRLVAGRGSSEKILTGVLSDWMRPQEVGVFLSHPRRLHISSEALATVECYGSATGHVLAVCRTMRCHEASGGVSIVAVHLADTIQCQTIQAAIETIMAEALELAVALEKILELHDRVRRSALETRTVTERLDEVQALVARATVDATRRSRVDRQLASLLESHGDDAACVEALCLEPEYCLWMCEQENDATTMSTVQHDGTKQIRKYEPTVGPHCVEILSVRGKRRGVVEKADTTTSDEELRLVASAIQSALARRTLEHDVRDLHAERRRKAAESTKTAERQDRLRREIVCHWHTVDTLLQASFGLSDTAHDRTAIWTEMLANVTRAIQQAVAAAVACVRIVFLTVDSKNQRVVETTDLDSSAPEAPLLRRLAALLNLWNHDDEVPRTKVVSSQDDSVRELVQSLFSSATLATSASSRLVVVTSPTSQVSTEPVRSFAVLVGLSTVASLPTDTLHTLEIDSMLVATACERWHSHGLAWHRALEAETALATATQQAAETEHWVAYMETVQSAARQLVQTAMDVSNDNEPTKPSGWMIQVEAFVRTACACNAVALYPVEEDGTISPICMRDPSLSPSFPSLLKTASSPHGPLSVETTHSGRRLVAAIHDSENRDLVLGVLVVDWHRDSTVPSIDVVHTVVRPWLAIALSVVHARGTARTAHDAMARQLTTLTHEKTEWDLEALELKRHVAQATNRHGTLQKTLHVAKDLLQQVGTVVSSIAVAADAMALWTAVATHMASLHSVHGVQLLEGTDPSVVTFSTLSTVDDASLHKALESGGLVRRCLASQQTQECRVACGSSSDYKRVRLLHLSSGVRPRCFILVVCTSDAETTHQQLDMVDHAVDLCVVVASHRAADIERVALDTAAASALELAVEDLSTRLQSTSDSLVVAERSRSWYQSLFCGTLARDLVGHDVWRCVEKTAQVSSTTLPTAKLTAMWKFLQDTATRRLELVLASGLTLQLYGVVAEGSFVFLLPSPSMDAPVRRGFFCVALQQLEQRREWRKMAQCIRTGKSRVYGTAVYFPVRKDENCPARAEKDARDGSEGEEEDEEDVGREKRVVGVLLIKRKAPIAHGLGAELSELVQEWVDTMAPRVEWIGRVVDKKQQHTTRQSQPTKTSQPRSTNALAVRLHGVDGCSADPITSETEAAVETKTSHPTWASRVNSNLPMVSGSTRSNQDEVSAHGDLDSDDERDAERTRERRRLAVTHGVLDFAFRVQSLLVAADSDPDKEDAALALRQLVARELKNVWRARGDDRKHALDACELFFGFNGVLSDSPDGSQRKTTTAPAWTVEFVSGRASVCADATGCRVWKVDACHWMASLALGNALEVVVMLTGSSPLSRVFDDDDECIHLPSLLRAMGFQTMRIVESLAHRGSLRKQLQTTQDAAAQRDVAWQQQVDELTQRATRERELTDMAVKLLYETDERVVVKTALDTMQRFTRFGHVEFQPTTAVAATSLHTNDSSAVAVETVLRVPVVAAGENELLGTLVARLTDNERETMETNGIDWTLSLVQRLADATAIAIVGLRQRNMLRQAETALVVASAGLEMHQQELLALQKENERLHFTLDELTNETERIQSVEQENVRFKRQLTTLRGQLRMSDDARQEMASQLSQYEAQFSEINTQLEKSLDAETQLLRLEETHAVTLAREARLEKKRRKQKLQLEHLMAERLARVEKDERDQAELAELRRQVAVLTEKQQHSNHGGGMDASSVATAVLQAQAQAMAQTRAYQQQQQSHAEWKQQQQQQKEQQQARIHSAAVQRRMVRQWQLRQHQQQLQKRKQLDLAQELRQLAALEVQEMTRDESSTIDRHHSSPRKRTRRIATWREEDQDDGAPHQAKVHDVRTTAPISKPLGSETVGRGEGPTGSNLAAVSRLRPPRIAVTERRAQLPEN